MTIISGFAITSPSDFEVNSEEWEERQEILREMAEDTAAWRADVEDSFTALVGKAPTPATLREIAKYFRDCDPATAVQEYVNSYTACFPDSLTA